jgi:hypothetical protein
MWEDKIQVKKGNIGECLVLDYLKKNGFVIYKPVTNSAHGFDNLATKNKRVAIIVEIKTKARMNKYEATGFDYKHYEEYKFISKKHNLPIFIFFVDEHLKKIYGNWLTILENKVDGFPLKICNGKIILFSLKNMKDIQRLSNDQCEELKRHNSRKYEYSVCTK